MPGKTKGGDPWSRGLPPPQHQDSIFRFSVKSYSRTSLFFVPVYRARCPRPIQDWPRLARIRQVDAHHRESPGLRQLQPTLARDASISMSRDCRPGADDTTRGSVRSLSIPGSSHHLIVAPARRGWIDARDRALVGRADGRHTLRNFRGGVGSRRPELAHHGASRARRRLSGTPAGTASSKEEKTQPVPPMGSATFTSSDSHRRLDRLA
jgi:hypothetical protein